MVLAGGSKWPDPMALAGGSKWPYIKLGPSRGFKVTLYEGGLGTHGPSWRFKVA